MKKLLLQFSILLAIFFGIFLSLRQINFVDEFEIDEATRSNEKKLGEVMLDFMKKSDKEIFSDSVLIYVNNIKKRLCEKNGLNAEEIKLHVFYNSEINAFALPDKHMVIYTGLLEDCKNAEELSGVMAHEIAHMQHDHIMKKMVKEIGITVLVALAGGDTGSEIMKETLKLLTSSAFDRNQESEADATAVKYLAKANIDPKYLADFLFRIAVKGKDIPKQLNWISTHPDSKERAGEVLKLRKEEKITVVPLMNETDWKSLQDRVDNEDSVENE